MWEVTRELCNTCSSIYIYIYMCVHVCVYIYVCMNVCIMYVCIRACVRDFTHMHGHKAFHLQLVSEPTHSYQGDISDNVLPFPPLYRPAWYRSNSDVPERRNFHHVRVKYHSKINYNICILIMLLDL